MFIVSPSLCMCLFEYSFVVLRIDLSTNHYWIERPWTSCLESSLGNNKDIPMLPSRYVSLLFEHETGHFRLSHARCERYASTPPYGIQGP